MTGPRCILIVLVIPLFIKLLMGHYGRLVWPDLLFLLYCPWAIYTLHLNNPESALSFGGSVALEFYGGYLLARAYIRTPETFAAMCRGLFFIVFLTIPFAMYEAKTGHAPIPEAINRLPFFYSFDDFYNELAGIRMGLERSQVIFSHPIHYGLFCSTTFALCYTGFKNIYSTTFRYLVCLILALGVFLSLSSGALLPMVLMSGLIFWAWAWDKVASRWVIFGVWTAFCYVVVDLLSNRTPIQVFLEYATFSPHNAYWRILIFEWGMKNVWKHPLYGLGLNEWEREWFMHSTSMDNFWLLNAVRYGIPGFLLIASGFALAIWKIGLRKIEEGSVTWLFRRAWMITLVGLGLSLCTVDVWATVFSYVAFLFGSGIWLISAEEVAPKSTSRTLSTRLANQTALPSAEFSKPMGLIYTRFTHTASKSPKP